MTGPEANEQYDLWVDRCRQQLERGAARNALAAWMQSEGVSADDAAAILEAARSSQAADPAPSNRPDAVPDAAPHAAQPDSPAAPVVEASTDATDAAVPSGVEPSAAPPMSTAPSPQLPAGDGAATVFAKAFGRSAVAGGRDAAAAAPGSGDHGTSRTAADPQPAMDPSPVTPQPPEQAAPPQTPAGESSIDAPHPAAPPPDGLAPQGQSGAPQPATEPDVPDIRPVEPPALPSALPSNPFGTPRAPVAGPAAPPPVATDQLGEATPEETQGRHPGASPPTAEEPHAESPTSPLPDPSVEGESATEPHQDLAGPTESGTDEEPRHVPLAEMAEATAEPQEDAASELDVESPLEDPHETASVDPDVVAPEPAVLPPAQPEPLSGLEPGEYAGQDDSTSDPAERESPEQPSAVASEPPTPEPSGDAAATGNEIPETGAPDEPVEFAESLEEAASRMGVDLRRNARHGPSDSYEDFIQSEQARDPDRSESPRDDGAARAVDEPVAEPDHDSGKTGQTAGKERRFGRRSCRPAGLDASQAGDEPAPAAHAAESSESGSATSDPAEGGESELARVIREAERGADQEPPPLTPPPEPKTDEEIAAAARKLGIKFRDDAKHGAPDARDGEDDELARAARELGISFRDDPARPETAEPDDATTKAAEELGINFREVAPAKVEQQSTLRRYWPIILVMALTAIAMPIVATLLFFSGQ